jgi:L-alanine-DL-glutamate epimerase-like enolase superfamily enzyme
MKITRIQATEVHVPFREGYTDSPEFGSSSWKCSRKWILEIETSEGVTGIGETPRGISKVAVEGISLQLVGKRVEDLNFSRLGLPAGGEGYLLPPVDSENKGADWEYQITDCVPFFGFEIALWDLLGKRAGLPLFLLFGGAWRREIPMGFWIGRMNPADAARQTEIGLAMGFRSLKMKAFAQDNIAAIVQAIHSAAGFPLPIVIDSNRKFNRLGEALRIDRSLGDIEGISYEDPFDYHPVEWLEFRRLTGRPLIWHATAKQLRADPVRASQEGTCDGINISPFSCREILTHAENASRHQLLHWQGSGLDLGIIDAFLLHTSAASRTAALPGDAIGHLLREDDLINESLLPVNSAIPVPAGSGLGVTLDHKAVERYSLDTMEF